MSKITALIATLVLGSSSAAMADPTLSFSASAHAQWGINTRPAPVVVPAPSSVIRDHRVEPAFAPNPYRPAWVALSEPTMLHPGRNTIRLGRPARYAQLRLQRTAGTSYISSVMIRFTDGTRQHIDVNQTLDARSPLLNLSVTNRAAIDRVVVIGSTNRRASFQLFGTPMFRRQPLPPNGNPGPLPPVYQPAGIVLAQDINFASTDGRRVIMVGADKGRLSTLRLIGLDGWTRITAVEVVYTDGSRRLMNDVNAQLTRGQSIDLSLDGRGGQTVRMISLTSDRGQGTGQISVTAF